MITETQFDPWTEEEITRLRDLAGKHSAREISTILGRGYHGISKKIRQLSLPRWVKPVKERPVRVRKPVKAKVEPKPVQARPTPVPKPVAVPVVLYKPEKKRPAVHGQLEWCSQCFAPVSNWQEHFQRLGHRRPAA